MLDVLWISDSPHLATGFGKASYEILSRLVRLSPCRVGLLAFGADSAVADRGWPFAVVPHPSHLPEPALIESTITELKPSVVVTFTDLWTPTFMSGVAQRHPVKWAGYFPIDAGPLPSYFRSVVEGMGVCVTTSEFSARVFREAFPDCPVQVAALGVDCDRFRPGEVEAGVPLLADGQRPFIVGCVARNQPRKGLPVLIEAFSRFAGERRDAFLHLHTNPWDPEGWALQELLARYGIRDRTTYTDAATRFEAVSDDDLARMYRSFDVFALPTMAEGFGMPLLEAMASGVPTVATDVGAVTEHLSGRGELIPKVATLNVAPHGMEFGIASVDAFATALERLYSDPALRAEYGRKGREYAESMSWDRCARTWLNVIDRMNRGVSGFAPEGESADGSAGGEPAGRALQASGVSAVVVLTDGLSLDQWKSWNPRRVVSLWLRDQEAEGAGGQFGMPSEWILLALGESPAEREKMTASLGQDAILMKLPDQYSVERRVRTAVRASRSRKVLILVPSDAHASDATDRPYDIPTDNRMDGKEVRLVC